LCGDISFRRRHAHDFSLWIINGGKGHGDGHPRAILAKPGRLEVRNLPALHDPFSDNPRLLFFFWRDQRGKRGADYFPGRIAKHPFRPLVPHGDPALQVRAHDGIIGGVDERRQLLIFRFHFLSFGDVVHDADGVPALFDTYREQGQRDVDLLTVLSACGKFMCSAYAISTSRFAETQGKPRDGLEEIARA
jgi:hypothetical protein